MLLSEPYSLSQVADWLARLAAPTLPADAATALHTARLIALTKPEGGIRPIAVEMILLKIINMCLLKEVGPAMMMYLNTLALAEPARQVCGTLLARPLCIPRPMGSFRGTLSVRPSSQAPSHMSSDMPSRRFWGQKRGLWRHMSMTRS